MINCESLKNLGKKLTCIPATDHLAQADCPKQMFQWSQLIQLANSCLYFLQDAHIKFFPQVFRRHVFTKLCFPLPVFSKANYKNEKNFFPKMKEFCVVFNIYLFTLRKQETHAQSKAGVARQTKNNLNQQSISVVDSGIAHHHVRSDSSHVKAHPSSLNLFLRIFSESSSNEMTHRKRTLKRQSL